MKKFLVLVLVLVMLMTSPAKVYAKSFTDSQTERAEVIAEICIREWETYGVLPSTAITQAFLESTLGDFCSGYNLWGIASGAVQYDSLEDGVYGYLGVINNGYYTNAPFEKDFYKQIRYILDGGYCQPEGDYYSKAVWTYETYELYKYDEMLFEELEKKEMCLEPAEDVELEAEEIVKADEVPSLEELLLADLENNPSVISYYLLSRRFYRHYLLFPLIEH